MKSKLIMAAALVGLCASWSGAPLFTRDRVVMTTSKGKIVLKLYPEESPLAVNNFVGLATGQRQWSDSRDGQLKATRYYDGLTFHRIIPNFMIQGGDPLGNGTGGPGYKFDNEKSPNLGFDRPGILAMAHAGPNTNGSQFFITVAAAPWLNGSYTIFGEVTEGMEVVNAIVSSPRQANDRPVEEIRIIKVDIEGAGVGGVASAPKPVAPPKLSVQLSFQEPSRNDILDAGEKGALVVSVSNEGKGDAYALKFVLSGDSKKGLSFPSELALGDLAPGKTVVRELPLESDKTMSAGKLKFKAEVREANGFDAPASLLEFEAAAFKAPKLELVKVTIGGLGVIKAGEVSRVFAFIRNGGEGSARKVGAALELGSADIFLSGDASLDLGDLSPGETKQAVFDFVVNNRFSGKSLPVAVKLVEAGGGAESIPLGLALGEGAPSLKVVSIKGKAAPAPAAPAPLEEDLDAPPSSNTAVDPEAYAVVIGVEKYRQAGIPPVEFAARDAQSMHSYLTRAMGFDPKNAVLLQNEAATKTDLEKYLGTWLRRRVTEKSRVFVFYAGHGAPNPATGEGFLIPYEGDPSYTEDTAFPVKRLYENLAKLKAREITVVLDACFSGQGNRSVIAKGARPLVAVHA